MPAWFAAGNRPRCGRCCSPATRSRRRGAAASPSISARFACELAAGSCRAHSRRPRPAGRLGRGGGAGCSAPCRSASRIRMSSPRSAGCVAALDSAADWPARYVGWERDLLAALGFGLDLAAARSPASATDLAYVSPRTGRAVSRTAGCPIMISCCGCPSFCGATSPADRHQIALGMALTGHFLRIMYSRRRAGPCRRRGRGLPSACGRDGWHLDNAGWVEDAPAPRSHRFLRVRRRGC